MENNFLKEINISNYRLKYLFIFIFLIFIIIIARFFYLQILEYNFYLKIIKNQQFFSTILKPERGQIFMQDKFNELYPLAINKDAKKLNDDVFKKLKSLNSSDLYFDKEKGRIYPNDNLAADIIGFLGKKNNDQVGQYGIEGYYESLLRGVEGILYGEKDTRGRLITLGNNHIKPAVNGSNLILTIDKNIQFIAEEKLEKVIKKWNADSGSVIVMDSKTGKIWQIIQILIQTNIIK